MIKVPLKTFITQAVMHAINQYHDGWSMSDNINDLDEDFKIRNFLSSEYFGVNLKHIIGNLPSIKVKDFIEDLFECLKKSDLIETITVHSTHIIYKNLIPFALKDYSIQIGDLFKHCKGHYYLILMLSSNSEKPEEELVTYQNIETGDVWTRPRKMFEELHSNGKPRFLKVSVSDIPHNLKLAESLYKIQSGKKVKELFSYYEKRNRNQYRIDTLKTIIKPGEYLKCITTINNRLVPGCKCTVKEMSSKYPNKIIIETEYCTLQAIEILYLKPLHGEVSFRNMGNKEFDDYVNSFRKS